MGTGTVSLYAADRLYVDARLTGTGDLVIHGQDLNRRGPDGDEYEYALTVAAVDIPVLLAALGAGGRTGILEALAEQGERIVRQGERRWLAELGVEAAFWARVG
jgi:hypothetical protein